MSAPAAVPAPSAVNHTGLPRPAAPWRARRKVAGVLALTALLTTACGSRLTGGALALAEGRGSGTGTATGTAGAAVGGGTLAANGASGAAGSGATGGPGAATAAGATGSGGGGGGPATAAGGGGANLTSASCNASNNGGATDVGVTATQITVGNITSITGVAPGLTQSAQQATIAWADYVNSLGGICGRKIKVQTYDDQNDAGQDYADATQACSNDFAMVGNASGFDSGAASAVQSCGIPDVAAEISTHEAGNVPEIFGASPGNAHYYSTGPAVWLKSRYPQAAANAAMIYLNVPATQEQAQAEMNTYSSVGWNYRYVQAVSPTEPNYAPYVQKMQSMGIQYVTEYSDDNSAARLVQAMAQANFHPQVTDFISEEYSQTFLQEAQGDAEGDMILMATAAYEEPNANPGMQLFLSWLNRATGGQAKHDIFGEFAWAAGMAFLQAATAVGPHLTRAALIAQLQKIGSFDGGGVMPPDTDFGKKIPSNCFSYFKVQGNGFVRVYPPQPGTYDCTSGTLNHY